MPVKDFILLVVYLLVPLDCNFAKKSHLPAICVHHTTRIHWIEIRFKEGKKLWKQISLNKSEKFKVMINFSVYIFLPWRKNLKIKSKLVKHIIIIR